MMVKQNIVFLLFFFIASSVNSITLVVLQNNYEFTNRFVQALADLTEIVYKKLILSDRIEIQFLSYSFLVFFTYYIFSNIKFRKI
jgi:hypothetical protein